MADFETVISRLQQAEGLDRGAAVARLKELHDDGQVPEGAVPDLESNLIGQRAKSIGERFATGVVGGLTEIPEKILNYVPGASSFESPHETMLKHIQSETEPTPYAEGAGELVGSATAYGAPFEALETGIAESIPALSGEGFLSTSARRAISGGILGGASTGTLEGAKQWAKYGVILPPVIQAAVGLVSGVGGVVGARLGALLARAGEEGDIEPEYTRVKEAPKQLTGPPTIEGPIRTPFHQDFMAYPPVDKPYTAPESPLSTDDVPLGPVDKKPTNINGTVKPETFVRPAPTTEPSLAPRTEAEIRAKIRADLAARSKVAKLKAKNASDAALKEAGVHDPEAGKAPSGSVFNPVKRKSPDLPGAYVGTRDVTTGQPFEGSTTVRLQSGNNGDVYINRTNPNADMGQPQAVSLKNPAVVMVTGNSPYREALAKLFPDAPQLLESFDKSEEPDATAREVLGRFIQKRGHDGLILKTDDVSKDIIVDYKSFEPGSGPITMSDLEALQKEPPKSVFARALKGDERPRIGERQYEPVIQASPFGPNPDPYVERRAIRVKGKVYEAVAPNEFHTDIIARHPEFKVVDPRTDRGFIGHDGKFYTQHELDQKVDAYVRRWGHPTPGDKVNFSEEIGFKRPLLGSPEFVEELNQQKIEHLKDLTFDPNNLASVDAAARAWGWEKASHLAIDIRASKFTPFEMLQHSAKADVEPPPIFAAPGDQVAARTLSAKDLRAAVKAVTNRFPRVMTGIVSKFHVIHLPEEPWLAETGVGNDSKVYINVNTAHLPDTISGQQQLRKFGYKTGQEKEFISTTIEHELTHAVQFWADYRGLYKTLGVPRMAEEGLPTPEHASNYEAAELQAQRRDEALTQFFHKHSELQQRVAAVPDDLKEAVLKQHMGDERAKLRPMVKRRFNQITGKNYTAVFAKKAKPDVADFENMDSFDAASRGGPIDSQIDPDLYYSPELKSMLGAMQSAGMKHGAGIRLAWDVSDNPDHLWFISRVFQLAREMNVDKAKFNKRLGDILTRYGAEDKNYDKLWEAVEGLRRAPDGSLSQTVANVDPKTAKAATEIREKIFDPAYEHITGIDRKAPAIVKSFGLPDTKEQWWRLKLLQSGQRAKVKNPTLDEFTAAQKTQGMLNFDESHDLRGEYIDGYITHQPIANERTELLNQIAQVDRIKELTGVTDPTGQALRQARVKRLAEIELQLAQSYVRSGPRTDVLPSKHYFGPTQVKDHPGAASVLVDKNIPQIAGRYVNGIVSKRYFDQVLHEFSKVSKTLPGSVRDYNIHYINNLRGLRGYGEDVKLANFVNDLQKGMEKLGIKLFNRVNVNDIRNFGNFAVQLQTFTKLLMTPVRFPAVQTTHLLMTTWPAAGTRATARGLGYFLSNPRNAVMEVMARGVVERDAEFLAAMDGVSPTSQGNLLKYSQAFSKYSDYFRKAVSWHTFRLQAMEPGFKPSPLARTFVKDVPGRGTIGTARAYADAMTDRTQFRLRAEGKPTAFVGGQARRAITQFKPWMVNYGTFFKDVARSGDIGMQARLLAALYFVGGPTAVLGGDLVYNYARNELIRHFGYVLPNDTGFQQVANHLGWGSSIGNIDLLSLRDPIGLPQSKEAVLPWLAGPTLGTLWDIGTGISDAKGDTGKEIKSTLSAISPEARALLDAGEEWRQGGVKSPMGEILAKRPTSSVIIRGLDLSPSVKSQRYNYRNDIITALQSGHPDTARQLLTQAKGKGIIFGPKDMRQIRATVTHYLKGQKLYEKNPWALLQ